MHMTAYRHEAAFVCYDANVELLPAKPLLLRSFPPAEPLPCRRARRPCQVPGIPFGRRPALPAEIGSSVAVSECHLNASASRTCDEMCISPAYAMPK